MKLYINLTLVLTLLSPGTITKLLAPALRARILRFLLLG